MFYIKKRCALFFFLVCSAIFSVNAAATVSEDLQRDFKAYNDRLKFDQHTLTIYDRFTYNIKGDYNRRYNSSLSKAGAVSIESPTFQNTGSIAYQFETIDPVTLEFDLMCDIPV